MKSYLFAILLLAVTSLYAQENLVNLEVNCTIDDLNCDIDHKERTIVLSKIEKNNQTKIIQTYKSMGCQFLIKEILTSGKYGVLISSAGYNDATINFEVAKNDKKVVLNDLVLKGTTKKLDEVTVYGNKKQFFKVESDKTTISVESNAMLNSGSGIEAVKRLPGVISSPTGSLTLNGKNVSIYIDGLPSVLDGKDLQNYLSSLPANIIEKVELIYNPGASFDANSSGSVINIVMSSKRLKGVNASFNIDYNFNKYQKPSSEILLNGKQKHFSWQTILGYNYIESEEKTKSENQFTSFNPIKNLNQEDLQQQTERNTFFRVATNLKLNKMNNLLFNYNLNTANDRDIFKTEVYGDEPNYVNQGSSKTKSINNEISFQYKNKLDTLGKTLDIIAFANIFDQNPKNVSMGTEDSFNNANIDFKLNNYYIKYDFVIPFEKFNFTMNTGGKFNVIKVKNNGEYSIDDIDPSFINFNYSENNLAFYIEAKKKIKRFEFSAGLRFENFKVDRFGSQFIPNSILETDKISFTNTNFFPNVNISYEVDEDINVSAFYSKKIEQPSYSDLDPNIVGNFNQYATSTGNINLKPTFFDNYELKISAWDLVQLGANYTVAKDDNIFIFNAPPNELVNNQTTQTLDRIKTFSAYFSFPIPLDYFFKESEEFEKRMNSIDKMNYIYFNINYIKSSIDGFVLPYENKPIFNYEAQSQIILPWDITNTISYSILSKGTLEIYGIEKPIQEFNISFNKDFINKKLKIGLHCFDVFNQSEINALISGENLNTRFYQKLDSRSFGISLTYNLGSIKHEQENINIETEKVKKGAEMIK